MLHLHFYAYVTVLLVLITNAEVCVANDSSESRPNFLVIIADDLCWRDLGFTGNQDVKTPNLDKLAKEGMQLTHMFTPAPTCSPCRHALYTGLYSMRSGAYPNHTRAYDGTKSIFTHLKQVGYRVALQGKTHIGPPKSFPFEKLGNADNFDDTKKFLAADLAADAKQPWLLVYASHDPHSPWTRGPKYDADKISVPTYLHDNPTTRENLAAYYGEISKFDSQVGDLMRLLEETKQTENTLVLFVSEQGSSFPYGGKWSLYDNGIRVASIARWPGKIAAGTKSRALLQYPDVPPTLLAAAGIDLTKIDVGCPDAHGKTGFDGESFLPVLLGKADSHRNVIFAQHTTVGINGFKDPYPMRAARDHRYKLIRNLAPENTYSIGGIHGSQILASWAVDAKSDESLAKKIDWLYHRPAEELYDLETDPLETHNLADSAEHADIKANLGKALEHWMRQQGDEGMKTERAAKSRQK